MGGGALLRFDVYFSIDRTNNMGLKSGTTHVYMYNPPLGFIVRITTTWLFTP